MKENSLFIFHIFCVPTDIIDLLRTSIRENGKIIHSWALHQLVIFDADPKDLEVLLSSPTQITKNNVYDMLSLWLGDGLLMSTGKKWHTRRKIITPTFHFQILESFVSIFDRQSSIMVEKLKAQADGKTIIDVFPVVCLTALDIIAGIIIILNDWKLILELKFIIYSLP